MSAGEGKATLCRLSLTVMTIMTMPQNVNLCLCALSFALVCWILSAKPDKGQWQWQKSHRSISGGWWTTLEMLTKRRSRRQLKPFTRVETRNTKCIWVIWGGVGWGGIITYMFTFMVHTHTRHDTLGWGGVITSMLSYTHTHRHTHTHTHSSCYARVIFSCAYGGVGWGNNIHVHLHTHTSCYARVIFSCVCTQTSCYARVIFSCSCTQTSCYATLWWGGVKTFMFTYTHTHVMLRLGHLLLLLHTKKVFLTLCLV